MLAEAPALETAIPDVLAALGVRLGWDRAAFWSLELVLGDTADGVGGEERHLLGVAHRNARRLLRLVSDLLFGPSSRPASSRSTR